MCIGAEGLARWLDPLSGVLAPGIGIRLHRKNRTHPADRPLGASRQPASEFVRLRASDPRLHNFAPFGQCQRPARAASPTLSSQDRPPVSRRRRTISAGDRADRGVVVDDVSSVIDKMKALKALGVRFAPVHRFSYLARLLSTKSRSTAPLWPSFSANANDAAVAQTIRRSPTARGWASWPRVLKPPRSALSPWVPILLFPGLPIRQANADRSFRGELAQGPGIWLESPSSLPIARHQRGVTKRDRQPHILKTLRTPAHPSHPMTENRPIDYLVRNGGRSTEKRPTANADLRPNVTSRPFRNARHAQHFSLGRSNPRIPPVAGGRRAMRSSS